MWSVLKKSLSLLKILSYLSLTRFATAVAEMTAFAEFPTAAGAATSPSTSPLCPPGAGCLQCADLSTPVPAPTSSLCFITFLNLHKIAWRSLNADCAVEFPEVEDLVIVRVPDAACFVWCAQCKSTRFVMSTLDKLRSKYGSVGLSRSEVGAGRLLTRNWAMVVASSERASTCSSSLYSGNEQLHFISQMYINFKCDWECKFIAVCKKVCHTSKCATSEPQTCSPHIFTSSHPISIDLNHHQTWWASDQIDRGMDQMKLWNWRRLYRRLGHQHSRSKKKKQKNRKTLQTLERRRDEMNQDKLRRKQGKI